MRFRQVDRELTNFLSSGICGELGEIGRYKEKFGDIDKCCKMLFDSARFIDTQSRLESHKCKGDHVKEKQFSELVFIRSEINFKKTQQQKLTGQYGMCFVWMVSIWFL
jgi:hypothetical protein